MASREPVGTLDEDMAFEVYVAAVDGVGTLADALVRMGLSDGEV